MTSISSVNTFSFNGLTATNKKMTEDEIALWKKMQEQAATTTVDKNKSSTSKTTEQGMQAATGTVATSQTRTDTQNLAQADKMKDAGDAAKEEFLKFQDMSWEEKVRAMILKSMGLDEESLAAMDPEDREKIEAKIKEKIEEEIEKKTGMKPSDSPFASTGTGIAG